MRIPPLFATGPLIVALALFAALPAAHAGQISLEITTACVHNKSAARSDMNQVNPGLGIEGAVTPDFGLAGGFYRNSFKKTSWYAVGQWTPLHIRLPAGWDVSAGIEGGLVSGYAHTNPATPFGAGALIRMRDASGWGINVVAVPNLGASSGFVGLQLVAPL
jgi:hypothetical protein